MTTSKLDQDEKQRRIQGRVTEGIATLKEKSKTLVLSTVDAQGTPNISYSPFALASKGFYIFISNIAKHCHNLKENGKVALMMIQDEQDAKVIYARQRLSFDAHAELIAPDSPEWNQGLQALYLRHGEVVKELSTMGDFNLFKLIPTDGLYVKGFGKAFRISADEIATPVHLRQGHQFGEREEFVADELLKNEFTV